MEQQGWIQLYRKFIDWEWYTDINTKSLFIHCLLRANHKDGKWRGNEVKRGQFLTSLNHLSQETGLSVRNIRTSLKHLESTGEVTRKATHQLTKITVCNYDTYNNLKTSSDTPTDTRPTHNRHTGDNKQEYKEYKKEEKEIIDYLNFKTGKRYRVAKGLKTRFKEGYSIEDAKRVIDIKVAEWGNNEKMKGYLTPETLFSQKFDKYLNQDKPDNKLNFNDAIQAALLEEQRNFS